MGMNKQKGNMFDWVTHTHTHIVYELFKLGLMEEEGVERCVG